MAYTTRANVETYLRTTFTSSTTPTLSEVESYVADVDDEVDKILGRPWGVTAYEEIINVPVKTNKFLVRDYPLVSVTGIYYNSGTEYSPTWTAFDNNYVDGDFIITDKYVAGNRMVKISYTAGHTTTHPTIEYLATLLVVKKIVSGDAVSKSGTQSLSIGSLSLTKNVGVSRLLNLDKSIQGAIAAVGKHKSVFR